MLNSDVFHGFCAYMHDVLYSTLRVTHDVL
jgi:hypothetical protein